MRLVVLAALIGLHCDQDGKGAGHGNNAACTTGGTTTPATAPAATTPAATTGRQLAGRQLVTLPPGVTWQTPAAGTKWFGCYRFASVFGVGLCVNQGGFTNQRAKCDHMANIMAQLIDNDGDGQPDDVAVNNEMKTKNYYVFAKELLAEEIGSSTAPYPACETDERKETHAAESCMGMSGGSGIYEAIINSCGSPTNRGAASATDRSTWAAATVPTNGCNPKRDATVEEVPTPNSKSNPNPYPNPDPNTRTRTQTQTLTKTRRST